MEIINQTDFRKFMQFIPTIRETREEWRIIEVSLTGKTNHNSLFIAKRLNLYFSDNDYEGKIFICNSLEILVLAHTGQETNPKKVEQDLEIYLPEYSCDVKASLVNIQQIKTIQLRLEDIESKLIDNKPATVEQKKNEIAVTLRNDRRKNLVMIADDDMFMRSLVKKALMPYADIVEVDKGNLVTGKYRDILPDMLLLDIHMPECNGLQVLDEIYKSDPEAYIVMLSADSNASNVIDSNRKGAKGFITKPFTEGKLMEFMYKCPNIRQKDKLPK